MRRIFVWSVFSLIVFGLVAGPLRAESPEESLKKAFPMIKYESIKPSAVKGVYEVLSGDRIFYYAPEAEAVFVGEMMTTKGRNLTQERIAQVMEKKIKEIPLEKAIKIGSGKNTVIEFTDPDCSFCRKAYQFFAGRSDVTKHVFLLSKQGAEQKAKYILTSADRAKAYNEAMSGKLDDGKFKVQDEKKGADLLNAHREIVTKMGISGTPYFFINGQVVRGANIPLIAKILEDAKK